MHHTFLQYRFRITNPLTSGRNMVHAALHAGILGVVSALVAAGQTWCASRFGPIYGGVISTIPSTIIPASVVLGLDVHPLDFQKIMYCVPIGVLLNIALLLVWRNVPMKGLWRIKQKTLRMSVMVSGSMIGWTVLAIVFAVIIEALDKAGVHVLYPSLAAFVIQVVTAMVVTVFGDRFSAKGEGKVQWKLYVFAAVLGLITGVALVFVSLRWDVPGGLLLAFPVILIASLSSLSVTYNETLPLSATTAMIGGSVSTSLYAIVFAEALPWFDKLFQAPTGSFKGSSVAISMILCWLFCLLIISIPVLFILKCLARLETDDINKIQWMPVASDGSLDTVGGDSESSWDDWGSDEEDPFTSSSSIISPQNTSARRLALEESVSEEVPLLFGSVISPQLPESPVPSGSSRLSPYPSNRRY